MLKHYFVIKYKRINFDSRSKLNYKNLWKSTGLKNV